MKLNAIRVRTKVAALAAVALAGSMAVITATPASADTLPGPAPVQQRSADNVTADALPTVQIDGVVWSQAIVGNTVYAGGSFANARPAGAAAGTNLTPRSNLLSYDITTGNLITSFAPTLNAQVQAVAASPDGQPDLRRWRLHHRQRRRPATASPRYNTATGQLDHDLRADLQRRSVHAIVATNTTVYVGGAFTTANGIARSRLAAFNATNGCAARLGADRRLQRQRDGAVAPTARRSSSAARFTNLERRRRRTASARSTPTTGAIAAVRRRTTTVAGRRHRTPASSP